MNYFTTHLSARLARWRIAVAVAAIGWAVAACSMPMADLPGIGLPENTPARPAVPAAYLPVHDVPPPRPETTLDPKQQARMADDLVSVRDRQEGGNAKTSGNAKTIASVRAAEKAKLAKKPDAESAQ